MDLRTKDELVEKYWNGTSSLEEERLLKKAACDLPELFTIEEQNLFSSMSIVGSLELPTNFGTEFLDKVEYEEAHEKYAVSTEAREAKVVRWNWKKRIMSIAATLLLLIGLSIGYQQNFSQNKTLSSLSPTERAAFEESQKALVLIAQKMNKVKLLSGALEKFDVTQNKIRQR